MSQSSNILLRSINYDQTLVLAIELSNKSWVLAAQVPGFAANQGAAHHRAEQECSVGSN